MFNGSFTISSNEIIVGIIGRTTSLDASNAYFGLPSITYPSSPPSSPFYGLDGGGGADTVTINANNEIVLAFNNAGYSENFRIITQVVPELGTYLLMGTFLVGVCLFKLMRKKSLRSSDG